MKEALEVVLLGTIVKIVKTRCVESVKTEAQVVYSVYRSETVIRLSLRE